MRKYISFIAVIALFMAQPSSATFKVEVLGINPAGGTIGQVLTKDSSVDYDYSWQAAGGGGSGITELTGDVTAGPGSGAQASTVVGIQGVQVNSSAPDPSAVLTYDGVGWLPATKVGAGGTDYFSWASALLKVHGDGTAGGRLKLNHFGNTRGTTLYIADTLAADSDFKFPPTNGTTGYCLKNTDGAGGTEWAACGGGGANVNLSNIEDVLMSAPLFFDDAAVAQIGTPDNAAGSHDLSIGTGNGMPGGLGGTVNIYSGDGTVSGDINLTIGNVMSGTKGVINLKGDVVTPAGKKLGIGAVPVRDFSIDSAEPTLFWSENDAAADNKGMQFVLSSQVFYMQFLNDALAGNTIMEVHRSGSTVTSVQFPQGDFTVGGHAQFNGNPTYFGAADATVVTNASPDFIFNTQTANHTMAEFTGPGDDGALAFITVSGGNEFYIQAVQSNEGTGGSATTLRINPQGGFLWLGNASNDIALKGYGDGTLSIASELVTSSSDARMKDKQSDFKLGLDAISKINPVVFKWKKDLPEGKNGADHIGFFAQDVEKAIPLAVSTSGNGMKSLDDRAIIAALVNANKELLKRVEALEKSQVRVKAKSK